MLTAVQINAAKPAAKAYKLSDSGGLYLLVQPTGAKLWRYKFRLGGVEGLDALGSYPEVSLAEARKAHSNARRQVAEGINPVIARRERKQALIQASLAREKGSFEAVAADGSAATTHGLRASTVRQRERELAKDLLPKLKARQIKDITRVEITSLLKAVEKRAPEVARNQRNHLWGIFEYAIDSGLADANPVPSIRVLKKRDQENHPALTPEEIGAFLRDLDDRSRLNEQTRIAMLLVMLTACRKKQLRELVPGSSALLFPNRRDPKRPMANRTLNAVMERLGYSGKGTPHGMRASFSTYFNGLNAHVDVIELCLAHTPMGKTRAAYNRHLYKDERRELLHEWADWLDKQRHRH